MPDDDDDDDEVEEEELKEAFDLPDALEVVEAREVDLRSGEEKVEGLYMLPAPPRPA